MEKKVIHRASAFISSTFEDMKEERNIIMLEVLPIVRSWAYKHGIIFDIVDLRWGITDAQAQDLHHTIKICLERVRDTDPLFLCFLGDRFGWKPDPIYFNQKMFPKDISKYLGSSATELEIWQALKNAFFDCDKKSTLFFIRNITNYDSLEDSSLISFFREDENGGQKALIRKIKEKENYLDYQASFNLNKECSYRINGHLLSSHPLDDLKVGEKSLKDKLVESIIAMLKAKYDINDEDETDAMDPVTRQQFELEHLSEALEIKGISERIKAKFDSLREGHNERIIMERGSGLSSQAALFIKELQTNPDYHVMYRFFGLDYYSKNTNDIIRSFALELGYKKAFESNLAKSYLFVRKKIERISEKKKVILILDGVSKDDLLNCASFMGGLRYYKALLFLHNEKDPSNNLTFGKYGTDESKALIKYFLRQKGKAIDDGQLDKIVSFADGDLKTIRLIVDYLIKFAVYDGFDQEIDALTSQEHHESFKALVNYCIDKYKTEFSERTGRKTMFDDLISLFGLSNYPISFDTIAGTLSLFYEEKDDERLRKDIRYALSLGDLTFHEYNDRYSLKTFGLRDEKEMPDISSLDLRAKLVLYYTKAILSGEIEKLSSDDLYLFFSQAIESLSAKQTADILLKLFAASKSFFYVLKKAGKKCVSDFAKKVFLTNEGLSLPKDDTKPFEGDIIAFGLKRTSDKYFASSLAHSKSILMFIYKFVVAMDEDDLKNINAYNKYLKSWLISIDCDLPEITMLKDSLAKVKCEERKNHYYFDLSDTFDSLDKRNVCVYDDNTFIVSESTIFVMDTMSIETKSIIPLRAINDRILATFYKGHTLFVLSEKGLIFIYHVETDRLETFRYLNPGIEADCLYVYKDGEYFAIHSKDGRYIIIKDGTQIVASFPAVMEEKYVHQVVPVIEEGKATGLVAFASVEENEDLYDRIIHYGFKDNRLEIKSVFDMGNNSDLSVFHIVRKDNDLSFHDYSSGETFSMHYENGDYSLNEGKPNELILYSEYGYTFKVIDGHLFINDAEIEEQDSDDIAYCFATPMYLGYLTIYGELIVVPANPL